MRNAHKILIGKPRGKSPVGIHRRETVLLERKKENRIGYAQCLELRLNYNYSKQESLQDVNISGFYNSRVKAGLILRGSLDRYSI